MGYSPGMYTKTVLESPQELLAAAAKTRSQDDTGPRITGKLIIENDMNTARLEDPSIEYEGKAEDVIALALKQAGFDVHFT